MAFQFIPEGKAGKREISYDLRRAVLCGYTGRDQAAVRRHTEELKKEGVGSPPSVPAFYPKPYTGISAQENIYVEGQETSGEVEYVILTDGDKMYVGLGSDHSDRALERIDILKSKQVCPTVIFRGLWDYEEIKGHWDRIEIRSWALWEGERILYQESTLGGILRPPELIGMVQQHVKGALHGIAVFSGTTPLITEKIIFADRFEGALIDPILMRQLAFGYSIHTLDWFIP